MAQPAIMREFTSGATRDSDDNKLKYYGFLSPQMLQRFAQYMHRHRLQADGAYRDPDNWKHGIPTSSYFDSGLRHFMDLWMHFDGTPELAVEADVEEILCALLFNVQGYLHETLKSRAEKA